VEKDVPLHCAVPVNVLVSSVNGATWQVNVPVANALTRF
jgi:hypothetical protein